MLVNLAKHYSLASRSRLHPSPPPRLHRNDSSSLIEAFKWMLELGLSKEERYEALQQRIYVVRMCSWLVDENEADIYIIAA